MSEIKTYEVMGHRIERCELDGDRAIEVSRWSPEEGKVRLEIGSTDPEDDVVYQQSEINASLGADDLDWLIEVLQAERAKL